MLTKPFYVGVIRMPFTKATQFAVAPKSTAKFRLNVLNSVL